MVCLMTYMFDGLFDDIHVWCCLMVCMFDSVFNGVCVFEAVWDGVHG